VDQGDRLFAQVLVVVMTVTASLLCSLAMVSPSTRGWDLGQAVSGQEMASRTVVRTARAYFRLSRGPEAFPAPVQTGEVRAGVPVEVLPPPDRAPSRRSSKAFPSPPLAPHVVGGPVGEMTLDPDPHASPPALRAPQRDVGGEPGMSGTGSRLPPPLALAVSSLVPRPVSFPPDEVVVARSRLAAAGSPGGEGGGWDDTDPLPEFRRYLPRAEACAAEASRQAGHPVTGKVILRFTVESSGWVREAAAVGGTLRDPDAWRCLVTALRARPFFDPRPLPVKAERAVVFAR
jgi:hypothetical protein